MILLWGTRELVIGADGAPNPNPAPSLRRLRDYLLRYANLYLDRAPIYFDCGKHQ